MNETETRPNTNYIDNNRAEQLLEKWSPVLDYTSDKVTPIENPHTRMNTAILLENQEECVYGKPAVITAVDKAVP